MKLKQIYNSKKLVISFEIFPPKAENKENEEKIKALFKELEILSKYNPCFISVTYGAGGSTREKTLELVSKIKNELNILPMPHFTCVGATKQEIFDYLKLVQSIDIKNILALRGDPPKGESKFQKPKNGFGYANELVEFIKENTDLGIAVAGYPQCHQECKSLQLDIINLKRKVDAGADVIITQLFYNNEHYFNFVEKTAKMGINIPIVPGILPITNFNQIERVISLTTTATLPDDFRNKLEKYKENDEIIREIGIDFAVKQCQELINGGAAGIHFYTLNKSSATESILKEFTLRTK